MGNDEVIQKVLEFLTPREGKILKMRLEGHTLQEIGKEFGVTRERIRQIGERIKSKVAKRLSKEELKNYIRLFHQYRAAAKKELLEQAKPR